MSLSFHRIATVPTATHAATHAWALALEHTYGRALDVYPVEHKRITAGYHLATQGHVQLRKDHALVASQSQPGKVYQANLDCQCQWFTYGMQVGEKRRCAHRWAYLLTTRALTVLATMWSATYITVADDGTDVPHYGFAMPLPEDSGYLFTDSADGQHRFLPAPHAHLVLHGHCAWIEHGVLCGMVPQALLDAEQCA